jgi:enoyl-CoA hydratase
MSDDFVTVHVENNIGVLTINRPKTLNALDVPTLLALEERLGELEADASVHVIVFTGAGDRAFVAGGDIADLNSRQGLAHYLEFAEIIHRIFRRVETCDKPTIAAVNGWALGGGTELLLSTDIRILADHAKLGVPEITLGLFPGAGGSQRLIRQISPCKAREMMFTGDRISAEEALSLGLVNKVVPGDELMRETMAMAGKIAAKSPLVLKLLKRAMSNGLDMPLPAALAHEQAVIGLVLDSRDAHEGCTAFLDKRPAKFEGR